MEAAAQERELQLLQGSSSWPFHATMEASWDASSSTSSGAGAGAGDCFLLSWEPPLGCLGVLAAAAGADVHGLLPLYMESSLASLPPPQPQDPVALPEELDDLLLNFWDASCYDDDDFASNKQQVAFNSSCILQEKTSSTVTTTNSSSFFCDDDDLLGSIFSMGPTLPEKEVFQAYAEPLQSASSSNWQADPQVSDVSGAQPRAATPAQGGGARAPPCQARSSSSSLKRATPEEAPTEAEYCSRSSKRRRATAAEAEACRVVCPFAVLKPDGLDGGATLADINARILMRPARPVRHPVGEFACAPRVSADKPGLSGKAVSGFTRLHTPGRGTITIIRTRG
ncbi:hypothetical protein GUJ93_ZPchr0002g26504 [Zizania palustris]|uniref:Protein XRI1 n=1 Tax=Zizania palustris TaxID=103762 RepID=A0A8J5S2L0_ZIZPA|nr:hypothetical protein GUJ93_ZPchr0002g26504 [Zizania palustris]